MRISDWSSDVCSSDLIVSDAVFIELFPLWKHDKFIAILLLIDLKIQTALTQQIQHIGQRLHATDDPVIIGNRNAPLVFDAYIIPPAQLMHNRSQFGLIAME